MGVTLVVKFFHSFDNFALKCCFWLRLLWYHAAIFFIWHKNAKCLVLSLLLWHFWDQNYHPACTKHHFSDL